MITVVPPQRKEQPKSKKSDLQECKLRRQRQSASREKARGKIKESQGDNSECISIYSVLFNPGSRTREHPGAEEAYDLTKENYKKW